MKNILLRNLIFFSLFTTFSFSNCTFDYDIIKKDTYIDSDFVDMKPQTMLENSNLTVNDEISVDLFTDANCALGGVVQPGDTYYHKVELTTVDYQPKTNITTTILQNKYNTYPSRKSGNVYYHLDENITFKVRNRRNGLYIYDRNKPIPMGNFPNGTELYIINSPSFSVLNFSVIANNITYNFKMQYKPASIGGTARTMVNLLSLDKIINSCPVGYIDNGTNCEKNIVETYYMKVVNTTCDCEKYDDTLLKQQLNDLQNRLDILDGIEYQAIYKTTNDLTNLNDIIEKLKQQLNDLQNRLDILDGIEYQAIYKTTNDLTNLNDIIEKLKQQLNDLQNRLDILDGIEYQTIYKTINNEITNLNDIIKRVEILENIECAPGYTKTSASTCQLTEVNVSGTTTQP